MVHLSTNQGTAAYRSVSQRIVMPGEPARSGRRAADGRAAGQTGGRGRPAGQGATGRRSSGAETKRIAAYLPKRKRIAAYRHVLRTRADRFSTKYTSDIAIRNGHPSVSPRIPRNSSKSVLREIRKLTKILVSLRINEVFAY